MRICPISKQFDPGGRGSEWYAHALTYALARRGHEADVFALGNPEALADMELHDQASVTFVARPHYPKWFQIRPADS